MGWTGTGCDRMGLLLGSGWPWLSLDLWLHLRGFWIHLKGFGAQIGLGSGLATGFWLRLKAGLELGLGLSVGLPWARLRFRLWLCFSAGLAIGVRVAWAKQKAPPALILVLMALSRAKRRAKRTWRFSGSV